MSNEVKAALITGILGFAAAVVAAILGKNWGEKNAVQQLFSQVTTVNGDNNTVTINSVDDFIAQYNKLLNENETLKAQNSQYFSDYTEQKNISNSLESQLNERPIVSYNNLGLCIDAEDITINRNSSMVTIDGREYLSKEMAEKLLPDNHNMTIKDNTLFIGRVVADRANLIDQNVLNRSDHLSFKYTGNDSYGNIRSDSISNNYYGSSIIFTLDEKYSYLKCTISMSKDYSVSATTTLKISADENIVYTCEIDKATEPYDVEIPINNCNLLSIEFNSGSPYRGCIISNAIVYN